MNQCIRYVSSFLMLIVLFNSGLTQAHEVKLRDKIGQMLIIGFEGKEVNKDSPIFKTMQENTLGGVILFDYDYQKKIYDKNITSPEQVKRLNNSLQHFNTLSNREQGRAPLPLLISVDYEGGKVNRLKEGYGFPKTISAANVGKMSTVEANEVAYNMATTLKDNGFNLNFAPMLDVNVNPDNPVIGKLDRSFSSNPSYVIHYGNIYSTHFLSQKVQCAYKHFPGHGSSTADSHLGFVDVTDTWQEYELDPFLQSLSLSNACGMVMTAHIVNRQLDDSGLPATLSKKMLTGILRDKLKFEGVIVSDDMQMKAISQHYGLEQALILAINAGVDMFIFGNQLTDTPQDPKLIIDIIEANVKLGNINEERINDAYQHIVKFKCSLRNK